MAKTPNTTAAAPQTVNVGAFTFDVGLPVPSARVGAAASSEIGAKLKAMPVGASFLETVTVPETITDANEREKSFKELAKTVTNRLSGATRRFAKSNAGYAFALRTVNDDVLGRGVRVYRVEAEAPTAPANGTAEGNVAVTA